MTLEQDEIFQTLSEMHEDSNYDALQELIKQQKGYHIQSIQCRVLQLLFQSIDIEDYQDALDDAKELLKALKDTDSMPADQEINDQLQELYYEKAAHFGAYKIKVYKSLFYFDGNSLVLKDSDQLQPTSKDLKLWISQLREQPLKQVTSDTLKVQKKGDCDILILRRFMERQLKPQLFMKIEQLLQVPQEYEKTLLETVQEVIKADDGDNVTYTEDQEVSSKKVGKKVNHEVQVKFKITQRAQTLVSIIQNLPKDDQQQIRDIIVLWLASEPADPVLLYNDTVYITEAVVVFDLNDMIPKLRQRAVHQLTEYVYKMTLVNEQHNGDQMAVIEQVTEKCILLKQKLQPLHLSIRNEVLKEAVSCLLKCVDFQVPAEKGNLSMQISYGLAHLKQQVQDIV